MLAIATNICREIDEAIIGKVSGTKEQMVIFTEKLLAIYFNENPTIFNNWQGSKKKENLIKILQQAGLMKVEIQQAESSKVEKKKKSIPKRNISCALPDEYLKNISSLSRNNIIERLKIKTK